METATSITCEISINSSKPTYKEWKQAYAYMTPTTKKTSKPTYKEWKQANVQDKGILNDPFEAYL